MRPLISVVMPVYNCPVRINSMLDSLEAQDYDPFELVIVDDGSTDATPDVLRALAASGRFPKLKLLGDGANHGVSWARNVGFDASEGEYVIFLDADDMLPSDYLSRLESLASEHGADYAACGYKEFDVKTGRYNDVPLDVPGDVSTEDFIVGCITRKYRRSTLWAVLFRRDYLAKYNLRSHVGCCATQDRELFIKSISRFGKGAFTRDPLYVYVLHDEMNTRRAGRRYRRYRDQTYAELREANYILRRSDNAKVRTAARCWLKVSAFCRVLALQAMTGRRDRFDRLVRSKPLKRLLATHFRYLFRDPEKCFKIALVFLAPGLYYAHYSDAEHAVALPPRGDASWAPRKEVR